MARFEYKVNINVLGSNNGQKVRRGIKPGLLVKESDGVSNYLYLFTHNRALNNCNYSGNRKGFLSVWRFDETYNIMPLNLLKLGEINESARTGKFGGVLFTISYETTATTATTATETTTTTTTATTETTNKTQTTQRAKVSM